MKKSLVTLVIFVYLTPISLFVTFYLLLAQKSQELSKLSVFLIPLLFMFLVCILVIINIFSAIRHLLRSQCIPFKDIMLIKLYLIPFYIINFICWTIASLVFHIAIIIWPLIPFIVAYTYLTMIGTSIYIIAKLIILRRYNIITTKQFVVHVIFQIVFAADLIDSITLTIYEKRRKQAYAHIYL